MESEGGVDTGAREARTFWAKEASPKRPRKPFRLSFRCEFSTRILRMRLRQLCTGQEQLCRKDLVGYLRYLGLMLQLRVKMG